MVTRQEYLLNIKHQIEKIITKNTIQIRHDSRKVKYYKVNEHCKNYISTKNKAEIIELARNRMYMESIKMIDKELNSANCIKFSFSLAYNKLPMEIRKKVTINELLTDKYVENWINRKIETMKIKESTSFYTANGEQVRSKSELIIADRLKQYGIPYRYEPIVMFGNNKKCPDFLIFNVITRKEYIWEHLGMMDTPEYCKSAIEKISFYEEHGFSIGDNLIITMESSLQPIDTNYVEKMIEKHLI